MTPVDFLPAFDKALKDIVNTVKLPEMDIQEDDLYYIGLDGSFGENSINPRQLSARFLGKMISIEGIVTKCKKGCLREYY